MKQHTLRITESKKEEIYAKFKGRRETQKENAKQDKLKRIEKIKTKIKLNKRAKKEKTRRRATHRTRFFLVSFFFFVRRQRPFDSSLSSNEYKH